MKIMCPGFNASLQNDVNLWLGGYGFFKQNIDPLSVCPSSIRNTKRKSMGIVTLAHFNLKILETFAENYEFEIEHLPYRFELDFQTRNKTGMWFGPHQVCIEHQENICR